MCEGQHIMHVYVFGELMVLKLTSANHYPLMLQLQCSVLCLCVCVCMSGMWEGPQHC